MKRDLDLLRKLVLNVEARDDDLENFEIKIEGYLETKIKYHAYLLVDSGLAVGIDVTGMDDYQPQWLITHLTSKGHDFADVSRNDTVWNSVKSAVKEKAGSVSLDILSWLLKEAAKGLFAS